MARNRRDMHGVNNPNYSDAGKRICISCGKIYHNYNKKSKYCSLVCSREANRHLLIEYNNSKKKIKYCSECGLLLSNNKNKYCDLHNPNRKQKRYCKICKKEIEKNKTYCSLDCCRKDYGRKGPNSICVLCGEVIPIYSRKYCDDCWSQVRRMKRGFSRKIDQNQPEIIEALEKAGCSVIDTSMLGGGSPDLLVGRFNKTYLIEVKNPKAKGKLNKLQQKWHSEWQGDVYIAYTVEDALRIVGAID